MTKKILAFMRGLPEELFDLGRDASVNYSTMVVELPIKARDYFPWEEVLHRP